MAEEDDGLVRGVGVLQRVFGDDRERDQPGTRHELLGVLVGFADVDKPGFALGKTLESFLAGIWLEAWGLFCLRLHKAAGLGWGVFPVA